MEDFDSAMRKAGYIPQGETITEEPKVEEQPKVEQPQVVTPVESEKPTEPVVEAPPVFDFYEELKTKTGKEFKTDEEIKTFFENYDNLGNQLKTKEEQEVYYKELENNIKEIVETYDPVKQAGSVEAYHKQVLAQTIGKGKNQYVVNQIVNKELDKIDNVKMAAYGIMFNAPDISEDDAVRSMLKKTGVNLKEFAEQNEREFDITKDLTPEQRVDISILASEAKDKFDTLKASVKLPDVSNYFETLKTKVKTTQDFAKKNEEGWDHETKKIADNPPTIKFLKQENGKDIVDFEYKMDEKFLKEGIELIKKDAILRNVEPTKENIEAQTELLKMYASYKNLHQIVNAYSQEKTAEVQKQNDDKIHNNQPINTSEAPPTGEKTKEEIINDQAREMLKKQGLL